MSTASARSSGATSACRSGRLVFTRELIEGGPARLLALVHRRLGDRHLPAQRPGRRGVGGGRPPATRPRARHRCSGIGAARGLRRCPTVHTQLMHARQARHPRPRRPPPDRTPARARRHRGAHPHAGGQPAHHDQRPRGGRRVRRVVLREPPALRELGGQRAPDPRAHDPPGDHAARPARARADRPRGRDLPLPRALPRRRPPLARPAARARGQRRRLRVHHRRADRRARRHGAPGRACCTTWASC